MKTQSRELRFVAKSAQEAVERVRNELGPNARVISVRQVTGSGLQRFLKAPRLEIVAREVEENPFGQAAESQDESERAPVRPEPAEEKVQEERLSRKCGDLLARAGFPPTLMARLEGAQAWREIQNMPVERGLPQAVSWLNHYRENQVKQILPDRIAFLGGPGSGKTTALCKFLAREVFIHGRRPEVLRLEVDKPHLDNGLSLYCDVLGVDCKEDPNEVDFSGEQRVLIDIPGFALTSGSEKTRVLSALDSLGVEGRVLILNAAYDSSILQRNLGAGAELGVKFQVLTHLDELFDYGKLWPHLFDLRNDVLFFSNGQNVAGDMVDDPFGYLMERTFPR